MQIRETKITPLPNGKSAVEVMYSDHVDEHQATTYLRYRCVFDPKGASPLAGVQREALQSAYTWIGEETLRLRNAMM